MMMIILVMTKCKFRMDVVRLGQLKHKEELLQYPAVST